ncbi:MAG: helix-turn-helix transcriptional regulator [Sulfurovum sp.]|nr:helix-turn-helix transcriptional regulator [Sulfurovum sp.]
MLSFLPKSPSEIQDELKAKFKAKRKALKLTQEQLAIKSGVSLGSLKRFEASGQISLESLLKLAFILECLGDFDGVCQQKEEMPKSIEDLI